MAQFLKHIPDMGKSMRPAFIRNITATIFLQQNISTDILHSAQIIIFAKNMVTILIRIDHPTENHNGKTPQKNRVIFRFKDVAEQNVGCLQTLKKCLNLFIRERFSLKQIVKQEKHAFIANSRIGTG